MFLGVAGQDSSWKTTDTLVYFAASPPSFRVFFGRSRTVPFLHPSVSPTAPAIPHCRLVAHVVPLIMYTLNQERKSFSSRYNNCQSTKKLFSSRDPLAHEQRNTAASGRCWVRVHGRSFRPLSVSQHPLPRRSRPMRLDRPTVLPAVRGPLEPGSSTGKTCRRPCRWSGPRNSQVVLDWKRVGTTARWRFARSCDSIAQLPEAVVQTSMRTRLSTQPNGEELEPPAGLEPATY